MRVKPFAWLSVIAVAALVVALLLISADPDGIDGTGDLDAGLNAASNSDYELAIANFTAVIESGNYSGHDLADIYRNRGFAYYSLGDFDRAIADFDVVVRLDPGDKQSYYNRGRAYGNSGDLSSDEMLISCKRNE